MIFVRSMIVKISLTFLLAALLSSVALANNGGVDSLRSTDLSDEAPAESLKKVQQSDKPLQREFVAQPPLIPHSVRGYAVNKDVNTCLRCHSLKNASKWGATPISVTHYSDRDGKQLADVSPRRYFCLQCHVTQANAEPLKENTFEPVDSLK